MNEIISLDQITTEIIVYKNQAAQSFIEIGKRLIKAKEMVPHGEWGKYLAERVSFSQSMANKLMKCATEFSNSESITNLPVAKAFELLALPAEQRKDFIENHDITNTSVRKLHSQIKQLKEDKNDLMAERDEFKQAEADTRKKLNETRGQIQQFIKRNEDLKVREANAEQRSRQLEQEIADLQDTIKTHEEMSADRERYIGGLKKQIAELENPKEIATAVITKDTPETLAKIAELEKQLAQAEEEKESEKMVINLNHLYVQFVQLGNDFCSTVDNLRSKDAKKAQHWLDKITKAQKDFDDTLNEIKADCPAGEATNA